MFLNINNKQNNFIRQVSFFTLFLFTLLSLNGCAQKKPKTYRVGILSGLDVFANIADGFKAQMTELGYIEGMNIIYDFQKANVDVPAERVILKRFVDSKVDLIFAFPTEPALLAKEATKGTNIPVIFAQGGVEGSGLVQSIAYPGDNITGVRYPGPDVLVRRLEIMHELIPEAKRFYLTYQLDYPTVRLALIAIRPVASVLGVTLVEVPIKTVEDIEADLNARDNLNDVGIDAILIVPESLSQSPRGFGAIIKFANKHKIPLAASNIKSGAVFSYTSDNIETGRLAASLADKIFKGVPAGTIMVATPTSDLRLNYKLAQELGLNVSKRLMGLAKEVTR